MHCVHSGRRTLRVLGKAKRNYNIKAYHLEKNFISFCDMLLH